MDIALLTKEGSVYVTKSLANDFDKQIEFVKVIGDYTATDIKTDILLANTDIGKEDLFALTNNNELRIVNYRDETLNFIIPTYGETWEELNQ